MNIIHKTLIFRGVSTFHIPLYLTKVVDLIRRYISLPVNHFLEPSLHLAIFGLNQGDAIEKSF